jgi:hypothetical protein
MPRNQFKRLLSIITFDEYSTRDKRKTVEPKFYKFSNIFNRFKRKTSTAYEPGLNLCVDETLSPYRGFKSFSLLQNLMNLE